MKNYNVYEQRFPINGGKDAKGGVIWYANLILIGQIRNANGQCPIAQARERYKVRHPVLHELDGKGEEVRRHV